MQHQQELSADKRADGLQRMALVFLVSFDAEAVVVAEVHGKNVIRHVWHAVPDDKVCRQPVPEKKFKKNQLILVKTFKNSHSICLFIFMIHIHGQKIKICHHFTTIFLQCKPISHSEL